jgi:hypothetical protein
LRITDRVAGLRASRVLERVGSRADTRWRRRVDLEADRRQKRHRCMKARVMFSGGDIFTEDSSLPDKSIDGWIKENGVAKRRRWRAEGAAFPETNKVVAARVMLSDCEISRVGSTSSDDQSDRRHKMIGGLWWQQWRKRGTA